MTSESGIPNAPPAAEIKTPAGEAPQAATEAVEALQDRLLRALADAENARPSKRPVPCRRRQKPQTLSPPSG